MSGRRTLDGRVAIVTGAARGIGEAYARHLAGLGATVVVADLDEAGAIAVAKRLAGEGASAHPARVDIADAAAAQRLADETVDEHGRIDIQVNNAAMYQGLQMDIAEEMDLDYWRRMVDVNLNGTFYMCRAVIPQMRRQQSGKIVNQSSAAAFLAAPLVSHYCVTKAAVVTLTQCLAKEVGEDNIQVNAIAPGVIGTEATLTSVPEPMRDMFILNSALRRMGQPEDLLGALEFLCTSMSDYVTGQTLLVDGGVYMLG